MLFTFLKYKNYVCSALNIATLYNLFLAAKYIAYVTVS